MGPYLCPEGQAEKNTNKLNLLPCSPSAGRMVKIAFLAFTNMIGS